MAGKRAWEIEHGFFAYYESKEHPESFSVRDIAAMVKKEYGKDYSKSTISNMVVAVGDMLATDPHTKEEYEKFKAEKKAPKYFSRWTPDGKVDSPYPVVRQKAETMFSARGYDSDALKSYLTMSAHFWEFVGKKKPEDWTIDDYNKFMGTLPQGSKYGYTIAVRQFGKQIAEVKNLTKGLKGEPRKPAIMKAKEFPQIWQQIKAKTLEITPEDLRKEMEFVLRVKPAIGARTGNATRRKGLWGTKIGGGDERTVYGLASHVQIIGETLIWTINDKGHEIWDINFLPADLERYIINYVKSKKVGDFLIDKLQEAQANKYLHQACVLLGFDPLTLHDMRKIYVSFLVKAGIPLEKAIRLNVGWKDIGTAYKHYLIHVDLGEKEAEYKRNLGTILSGVPSA